MADGGSPISMRDVLEEVNTEIRQEGHHVIQLNLALAMGGMLSRMAAHGKHAKVSLAAKTDADNLRKMLLLSCVRRIYSWAKRTSSTVEELFTNIDIDGSGSVDVREFRAGMATLGLKFDDRELGALVEHMDDSGDGVLDTNEFCLKMTVSKFSHYLHTSGETAAKLFNELDADGSGQLEVPEFHKLLERIGITVPETAAKEAMEELDLDGDASLEIDELLTKLKKFQRMRRVFATTVLGSICEHLNTTKTSVVRVFARVDADGSGSLDVLELQEAFRKMKQDLSELEVEEIMRELNFENNAGAEMTSRQFLDKIKQFEREHTAYAAKCEVLFKEFDLDNSGKLGRDEVNALAHKMGLSEQLGSPDGLTLDIMIEDIEKGRRETMFDDEKHVPTVDSVKHVEFATIAAAEKAPEEMNTVDGKISFKELLPWFLNVGRSYLPAPHYPAIVELDEPSEEQLRALFEAMDEDNSGTVNLAEATEGTLTLWPFVDEQLVANAFEAADADRSDLLQFEEFDELVRCLQFLNRKRHEIAELMGHFVDPDGRGVDVVRGVNVDVNGVSVDVELDEIHFYMCLSALGIHVSDRNATSMFNCECVRLKAHSLSAHQFLMWVCRRECVDKENSIQHEQAAIMRAQEVLEAGMTDFGDIYFEDLARVVFEKHRGVYGGDEPKKSKVVSEQLSKMRRSAAEAVERVSVLKEGISIALDKHESFPRITDEVIRQFVLSATSEIHYAGQNIITQDKYEDTFFVIRRGRAEILVDDEVVGSAGAMDPLGELALMYGTRRAMTVRCAGPCEVFVLDRASYDTGIATLEPGEREGPLVVIMHQFWQLVSGLDGSKQQEVDYQVYLKYHNRVTKTLMSQDEGADFDEHEQREFANEDWSEDCKRFGIKTTGVLTISMFFDSLYRMVDLWAGELKLSFVGFLELLFDNIACKKVCDVNGEHWAFRELDEMKCEGEKLDAMQDAGRLKKEAEEAEKKAEDERRRKQHEEDERLAREKRKRLRELHALQQAAQKKSDMENDEAALNAEMEKLMSAIDDGDENAKFELGRVEKERLQVMGERIEHEEAIADPNDDEARRRLAAMKREQEEAVEEAEALFEVLEEELGEMEEKAMNPPLTDMLGAVMDGDLVSVLQCLEDGSDPNVQSKDWSLLHLAAQNGHHQIVDAIIGAGGNVAARLPSGATALHVAADAGQADCVASLLRGGADHGSARDDGATSLHMAAARGYPRVVQQLLDAGADSEAADKMGGTPLAIASHNGNMACERLIRSSVAENWKKSKQTEWGYDIQGAYRVNAEGSSSTVRLPSIGGARSRYQNFGTMAQPDPYRRAQFSGPGTAVGGPRPRPSMQSLHRLNGSQGVAGLPPRTPRRGKRNNAPQRAQWVDKFETKQTDGMGGSVEEQLQSVLGSKFASTVSEIVQGICGEAEKNLAFDGACHHTRKLSLTHLRMLHGQLKGGSIVLEAAVRSCGGQDETCAVRVIAMEASHSGVADPCIMCLGFRGPLDVTHFGSPGFFWDPVAIEETVEAARAACREHAALNTGRTTHWGGQTVTPSLTARSRLIAYGEDVPFFGTHGRAVPWHYKRRVAEAVTWLRGGENLGGQGEVVPAPVQKPTLRVKHSHPHSWLHSRGLHKPKSQHTHVKPHPPAGTPMRSLPVHATTDRGARGGRDPRAIRKQLPTAPPKRGHLRGGASPIVSNDRLAGGGTVTRSLTAR